MGSITVIPQSLINVVDNTTLEVSGGKIQIKDGYKPHVLAYDTTGTVEFTPSKANSQILIIATYRPSYDLTNNADNRDIKALLKIDNVTVESIDSQGYVYGTNPPERTRSSRQTLIHFTQEITAEAHTVTLTQNSGNWTVGGIKITILEF